MSRTRAELDEIRASNRSALGLAGRDDSHVSKGLGFMPIESLGAALGGAVQSIRVRTSFPETDNTWNPNETSGPTDSGDSGAIGKWILAHVTRPKVDIQTPGGVITLDPYKDFADYSVPARILGWGVGAAAGAGIAWSIYKALFGGRRS